MDKNEARQILLAYRADLSELEFPEVKEALKMAAEDPELGAFLSRQQAFDRAFAGKLKEIEAPAGLMERILASAPTETAPEPKEASKIIWWKHPGAWSAAACFLVLMALAAVYTQNQSQSSQVGEIAMLDKFAQAAAEHSPTVQPLDFGSNEIHDLSAFLVKEGAPNPHGHPHPRRLPENMDQLSGLGCLTFNWKNNPVGILCLKGRKIYNLYMIDREGITSQRNQKEPSYKQFGNYATALWIDDNLVYVLTVKGKTKDLSPLL